MLPLDFVLECLLRGAPLSRSGGSGGGKKNGEEVGPSRGRRLGESGLRSCANNKRREEKKKARERRGQASLIQTAHPSINFPTKEALKTRRTSNNRWREKRRKDKTAAGTRN